MNIFNWLCFFKFSIKCKKPLLRQEERSQFQPKALYPPHKHYTSYHDWEVEKSLTWMECSGVSQEPFSRICYIKKNSSWLVLVFKMMNEKILTRSSIVYCLLCSFAYVTFFSKLQKDEISKLFYAVNLIFYNWLRVLSSLSMSTSC